jgi:hypothetical protein
MHETLKFFMAWNSYSSRKNTLITLTFLLQMNNFIAIFLLITTGLIMANSKAYLVETAEGMHRLEHCTLGYNDFFWKTKSPDQTQL